MRTRIWITTGIGAALIWATAAFGQAGGSGSGMGGTGSGMGGSGGGAAGMQGSGTGGSMGGSGAHGMEGSAGQSATNVTTGQITSNPQQYYGKEVQVSSAVEDMHGQQLFSLGEAKGSGAGASAGQDEVLVMAPQAVTQLRGDQEVTVKGTLRQLNVSELQRDYDWFDSQRIDAEVLSRYSSKPVIIAESIRTSGGQELLRSAAGDAPKESGATGSEKSGRGLGDLPGVRDIPGASDLPGGAGEGMNR